MTNPLFLGRGRGRKKECANLHEQESSLSVTQFLQKKIHEVSGKQSRPRLKVSVPIDNGNDTNSASVVPHVKLQGKKSHPACTTIMGKFKVKPTRAVAKPFKSAAAFLKGTLSVVAGGTKKVTQEDDDDSFSSEDEEGTTLPAPSTLAMKSMKPVVMSGVTQGGRVSKAKKRKSVRAKTQQKSVSFSKNLTEVGKRTGKDAAKVVDEIVQSHAALLLASGQALPGILKGSPSKIRAADSDPNVVPIALNAPLNKILRKDIKDKKTRIKARKEIFRKKLGLIKAQQDEAKAALARQKTVIVGDMKPMTSILDALEEETKKSKEEAEQKKKAPPPQPRKKKKFSVAQRQKELLDGLAFFKNALH